MYVVILASTETRMKHKQKFKDIFQQFCFGFRLITCILASGVQNNVEIIPPNKDSDTQ